MYQDNFYRNNNRIFIAVITALLIILIVSIIASERSSFNAVKSGEYTLTCLLGDGYSVVDPDMVVDHIEDTWLFKNGYASNCRLTKGK